MSAWKQFHKKGACFRFPLFDWQLATNPCFSHLSNSCYSSPNNFPQTSSEQLGRNTWSRI